MKQEKENKMRRAEQSRAKSKEIQRKEKERKIEELSNKKRSINAQSSQVKFKLLYNEEKTCSTALFSTSNVKAQIL